MSISKKTNEICFVCEKKPVSAFNSPRSLHKTKRIIYPNLVNFGKDKLCTRCLRSLKPKKA